MARLRRMAPPTGIAVAFGIGASLSNEMEVCSVFAQTSSVNEPSNQAPRQPQTTPASSESSTDSESAATLESSSSDAHGS